MKRDLKTLITLNLIWLVVKTLKSTWRVRFLSIENKKKAHSLHPHDGFAFAIWHGNALWGCVVHQGQKFTPLCSRSKDGEVAAFLCEKLGFRPVRGSSSKGGKEARDEILALLMEGYPTALTVDGPRGPIAKSKAGAVSIARDGACAILPLGAGIDRYWQLKSWDQFKIPKPFAKIAVVYAEPIQVPSETEKADFEKYQHQLDASLNSMEDKRDTYLQQWKSGLKAHQL